jgi:hypothetical protein
VFVEVHGTFGAAEFPEGGVFPLMEEGEFTALIDDATNNCGERVADPRKSGFGVESAVEADVFDEGE